MKAFLYPTFIKIKGCSEEPEAYERMKNNFSVWDVHCFRYTFGAYVENLDKDTCIIAGGVSIDTLYYYFPDIKVINKTDQYEEFMTVNKYIMRKSPRDEIQTKAIKFLKRDTNQKYLALQTGQGKTYCAINYCHFCRKLPIIILDQESLVLQWKEKIMEYTSAVENDIYIISGRPSVEKLYKMSESKRSKIKFILAFYQTLQSLYETDELEDFFKDMKIGLKIFDEAHLQYKSIFYINSCTKVETIYLSATPGRVAPEEEKLYKKLFWNVPMHKTKLTEKYYNIVMYNINMKYQDRETVKFHNKRGFDVLKYSQSLTSPNHIEDFYNVIEEVLRKVCSNNFNRHKKLAILVKLIEQTELVSEYIDNILDCDAEENGYERVMKVGVLTGKTPKSQKRLVKEESDIIVTTDKSFAKGIDVANLEILINFVPIGCSQNTSNLNQFVGRLRKLDKKKVFYVDIVEKSVSNTVSMSRGRLKYYKTIAKKINVINGYGC